MTAIVPQIGPVVVPPSPAASQTPSSGKSEKGSFASMLAATSEAGSSSPNTSPLQGSGLPASGGKKMDAKPSGTAVKTTGQGSSTQSNGTKADQTTNSDPTTVNQNAVPPVVSMNAMIAPAAQVATLPDLAAASDADASESETSAASGSPATGSAATVPTTPAVTAPVTSPTAESTAGASLFAVGPRSAAVTCPEPDSDDTTGQAAAKTGLELSTPANLPIATGPQTQPEPMKTAPIVVQAAAKPKDAATTAANAIANAMTTNGPAAATPRGRPQTPSDVTPHHAQSPVDHAVNAIRDTAAPKAEIEQLIELPKVQAPVVQVAGSNAMNTKAPSVDAQAVQGTTAADDGSRADAQQMANGSARNSDNSTNSSTAGSKSQFDATISQAVTSTTGTDPAAVSKTAQGADGSPANVIAAAQAVAQNGDNKSDSLAGAKAAGSEQVTPSSTGTTATHASGPAPTYTSLISSAKLVERIGESELRLGIRAGEFGSVDIRTSMARNQFTAEISVERGDLGRVMAAELPSLQNRLSEQRIPVANIVLQNQAGGNSNASEQQKPRDGQATQAPEPSSIREEMQMPAVFMTTVGSTEAGTRLDLHM